MEAVSYFVLHHMAWMEDGGDWNGAQTAAETIIQSGEREGSPTPNSSIEKTLCTKIDTYAGPDFLAEYCGDCEDFAILRASLLWHLGVSLDCVVQGDYHPEAEHPAKTYAQRQSPTQATAITSDQTDPSGPPPYYNYETAEDLFEDQVGGAGKKKGGHTFNIVTYKNKYRIMDYYMLGYSFSTSTEWESHRVDSVWSSTIGKHWREQTAPQIFIHNYPGLQNAEKCYDKNEDGTFKDYWTPRTLYKEVCP
jgi:hypothetical protein